MNRKHREEITTALQQIEENCGQVIGVLTGTTITFIRKNYQCRLHFPLKVCAQVHWSQSLIFQTSDLTETI